MNGPNSSQTQSCSTDSKKQQSDTPKTETSYSTTKKSSKSLWMKTTGTDKKRKNGPATTSNAYTWVNYRQSSSTQSAMNKYIKYNQCTKQWTLLTELGLEVHFDSFEELEDFVEQLKNPNDAVSPERNRFVEVPESSRWHCFYNSTGETTNGRSSRRLRVLSKDLPILQPASASKLGLRRLRVMLE